MPVPLLPALKKPQGPYEKRRAPWATTTEPTLTNQGWGTEKQIRKASGLPAHDAGRPELQGIRQNALQKGGYWLSMLTA
jgi:hypothetical protein